MIKVSSKSQLPEKIAEGDFILIDTNGNEKETRRIMDSLKGKKVTVGVYGHEDFFNRRVVETMKINYLINAERNLNDKKDTLKQRDSGLNHVVAKEMATKKISLVIDFENFAQLSKQEKALILARIIQNIKVCRKAKCSIKILSNGRDKKDIEAFASSIGMSSQQVSEAFLTL
jgi:ribonuclease P/MRP protein subunit RPP1